jgi:hypothetical protein
MCDESTTETMLGVVLVEAAIEVARLMQQVGSREVLVKRRVLRDERDCVERGKRTGTVSAEHPHLTGGR